MCCWRSWVGGGQILRVVDVEIMSIVHDICGPSMQLAGGDFCNLRRFHQVVVFSMHGLA
jgi:hypothetical protein